MRRNDRFSVSKQAATDLSRRSAFGLICGAALVGGCRAVPKVDTDTKKGLVEKYALLRRAYQTGNVELLRGFYSNDVVLASEGDPPVVGIEAVIASGRTILPNRRDIGFELLRAIHSFNCESATHFARLTAYPRDPQESPRIATAILVWNLRLEGWQCDVEVILIQDMAATPNFRTA